jgi:hypothetical protein
MRLRFALLALPIAAAALAFAACQGESEGMPCDKNAGNSGNDDCQSPLVCTSGLANVQGARCCPQDRTQATTPECAVPGGGTDANPAPPTDASSGGDAPSAEAAGDAPAEAKGAGGDAADGATGSDGPTE